MVTCVDQEVIGAFDRNGRHGSSVSYVIRVVKWHKRKLGKHEPASRLLLPYGIKSGARPRAPASG